MDQRVIEIIEFKNPSVQRLCISNIKWSDSTGESGLALLIKSKVSAFGLVHSVIAKKVVEDSHWYAYVDMYSQKAIEKAHIHLKNNLILNSNVCKVAKVKGRRTALPLAKDKCEALANYYLGFNGWTSFLLYHKHESSELLSDNRTESKALQVSTNKSRRNDVKATANPDNIQTEKYQSCGSETLSLHQNSSNCWSYKISQGKCR